MSEGKRKINNKKRIVIIIVLVAVILFLVLILGFLGNVAAMVNGEKISVRQLDAEISKLEIQNPDVFEGQSEEYKMTMRQSLLSQLADRLIVEQVARKAGIKVSDDDVEKQYTSIRSAYPDDDDWNLALANAGYTEDTYHQQVRYDLYHQKLLAQAVPEGEASTEEAKAYYEENKDIYISGDSALSFEKVEAQIKSQILGEKRNEALRDLLEQAKRDADIVTYDPQIKKFIANTGKARDDS
jgi:hypothetical protein